jgi:hypothetical protein
VIRGVEVVPRRDEEMPARWRLSPAKSLLGIVPYAKDTGGPTAIRLAKGHSKRC